MTLGPHHFLHLKCDRLTSSPDDDYASPAKNSEVRIPACKLRCQSWHLAAFRCVSLLLHQRDDRLALLPDQEGHSQPGTHNHEKRERREYVSGRR